ncbi:Protein trichome birefringence-like 34 [Orobanche minor]
MAEEWGESAEQNCYGETNLILEEGYTGMGTDPKMMRMVEATIDELQQRGLYVQMMNITQLSECRKEGHPSIYRKQWEPLSEEQISNPLSYSDCIHWCLPGVPDVWNELLYAYIFNYGSKQI